MFVENGPRRSIRGLRTHRMIDVMPVSVESAMPMLGKKDMAKLVENIRE